MSNSRSSRRNIATGLTVDATLPVVHTDGSFHSERTSRLVEIIRETWPVLDVKYIPRENCDPNDPKYLIVENCQGRELPVMFVKDDKEFDGSILEKLIVMDSKLYGNVHDTVEAHNAAVRLVMQKEAEEKAEERKDIIKHAIASNKFGYTIPGKDGKPVNLDIHGAKILRGEVE